jgi:hypothetical protein
LFGRWWPGVAGIAPDERENPRAVCWPDQPPAEANKLLPAAILFAAAFNAV